MHPVKSELPATGFRHLSVNFGPFTSKGVVQRFYDDLNSVLDQSELGEDIFFLNLGYIHDGSPSFSVERLSSRVFDRESHQLVLELIGDCDLKGKSVLEVGCGRGGAAYVMHKHFNVGSYLGIDLSEKAIDFCRRTHQQKGFNFLLGDAENLAVPQAAFDVVINLESAHNYPDIGAFFLQVNRVLKPGGYFLFADSMRSENLHFNAARLGQAGFELRRQLNITSNILRATETVSQRRRLMYQLDENSPQWNNFLAVPGSDVHKAYRNRDLQYWLFKMRKSPH